MAGAAGATCGHCRKKWSKEALRLACKGVCGLKYHLKCAGVTDSEGNLNEDVVPKLWHCETCVPLPRVDNNGEDTGMDVAEEVRQLKVIISGLAEEMKYLLRKDRNESSGSAKTTQIAMKTGPENQKLLYAGVAGGKNLINLGAGPDNTVRRDDGGANSSGNWPKTDIENDIFVQATKPEDQVNVLKRVKGNLPDDIVRDHVDSVYPTKGGAVIVKCSSQAGSAIVQGCLKDGLGETFNLQKRQMARTRVCALGAQIDDFPEPTQLRSEQNIAYVVKQIAAKNNLPADCKITVLTILKVGSSDAYVNIILLVDMKAKDYLLKNRLKIGFVSCKVQESFFLRMCYNCCGYNHTSVKCNKGTLVCIICAGDHKSNVCKKNATEYKCYNCSNHNAKLEEGAVKWNDNHKASDTKKCESFRRALHNAQERAAQE